MPSPLIQLVEHLRDALVMILWAHATNVDITDISNTKYTTIHITSLLLEYFCYT